MEANLRSSCLSVPARVGRAGLEEVCHSVEMSEGKEDQVISQNSPVTGVRSDEGVARGKGEKVWVSCPLEMPCLGCLGSSASWEPGPQDP